MKQLTFFLTFCLLGLLNANLFGSVTIGSNVSIPVLNSGNVNSLFTVTDYIISQDIIIDGNLEISLSGYIFNGITISSNGGDLTFTDCGGPYLTFRNCTIEGGYEMVLEDSYLFILGTEITDWFTIDLTQYSRIDIISNSTLSDIFNVGIHDESTFNAYQLITDDAPLSMEGWKTTIILQECELENNFPAGVTLRGGGTYFGRENIFHDNENAIDAMNPDGLFTWLKETGSQFYGNKATPFELDDVSEIFLINNDITVETLGEVPIPIRISRGSGATVVQGNHIDASDELDKGIIINRRSGAYVEGNYVQGIYAFNQQLHPNGISLTMDGNLTAEHNHVYDNNTGVTGILVSGCPGAMVSTNYLNENTRNIDVLSSDGITLETNLCAYGGDADIMMTNSQMATICNNECYHGTDGIKISGTNMMMEMNTNAISYCDRGLVYKQDVLTNTQAEKGNTFVLNNLGAEFEDVTDPSAIYSMRYIVRDLTSEYPSHTPSDWFVNSGTTALDCTPMGPVPPIGIKPDVGRLIGGLVEVTPDGKCTGDIMIALRMIEAQPDFLEDEDLEDFYETYHSTTVDKLPLLDEIVSTCMALFPESTPVLEIGEEGSLENLEDNQDYMDEQNDDYEELVSGNLEAIDDMIDNVSELEPENGYEESYQFAVLQLLGLMKGDTLTSTNESDVIDLAEGCVTEDGPGVYIAQVIAAIAGLNYTPATSCTPVTPRSIAKASEQKIAQEITILPNPVSNYLELSSSIKSQTVHIFDMMGRLVFERKEWSGRRINLPNLQPGIYWLKIEKYDQPIRFVKS